MKNLLACFLLGFTLVACEGNQQSEDHFVPPEHPEKAYEVQSFMGDTLLVNYGAFKVWVILESDQALLWKMPGSADSIAFEREATKTIHLNPNAILTTWTETGTDGDHITQYLNFKEGIASAVMRKSTGEVITHLGIVNRKN